MAPNGFRLLFALFLAATLLPKDSSADLLSLITRRPEDSSENEAENSHTIFGRFFDDLADKFGRVAHDVRSAANKFADGLKSTVDGAVNDAGEVASAIASRFNPTIFPGTNWCGAGSRARGFDDFGIFGTADHCCRAHDNCPDVLIAGESRNGLKNDGQFTLSNCVCDEEFYWCLKNSTSLVAKKIGITYFNILGSRCYTNGDPSKCGDESSYGHCDHRDGDGTEWKWVDAKHF